MADLRQDCKFSFGADAFDDHNALGGGGGASSRPTSPMSQESMLSPEEQVRLELEEAKLAEAEAEAKAKADAENNVNFLAKDLLGSHIATIEVGTVREVFPEPKMGSTVLLSFLPFCLLAYLLNCLLNCLLASSPCTISQTYSQKHAEIITSF